MPMTREQIAEATGKKLEAAIPTLAKSHALIGLDGFVDEIIAVVDKRTSFNEFSAIKTIAEFGQKILNAAGQSSNYELVVKQMKLGGNGPIMANALAAAGPGGRVRLRAETVALEWVMIAVEDDGPGIAAGVADRLFEPFATTKPTGTGLGLNVSRRVAEAHGGRLEGGNRPEGGACFSLTLPGARKENDHADPVSR